MSGEMDKARERWAQAADFPALCRLAADYATGRQPFFPSHGGDPDPETNAIASHLEQLNLKGLLTTCSQPGDEGDDRFAQRAFVDGYAVREDALALAAKSLYSDILVLVFPPGTEGGYHIPVTIDQGQPFTWVGMWAGDEELEHFASTCSDTAMAQLRAAWYVTAIDPVWGRKEHLWEVLLEPPRDGFDALPHPEHEHLVDFVEPVEVSRPNPLVEALKKGLFGPDEEP